MGKIQAGEKGESLVPRISAQTLLAEERRKLPGPPLRPVTLRKDQAESRLNLVSFIVPGVGFEPTRPCGQGILSATHMFVSYSQYTYLFYGNVQVCKKMCKPQGHPKISENDSALPI